MKVKMTFTEPVLGTLSGNRLVTEEFIISKHPNGRSEEESEAMPEEELEKGSTVFPRTKEGKPLMWDYQIKGFLKSACEQMIHSDTMKKEELRQVRLTDYLYKKTIDKQIFVAPRMIILNLSSDVEFIAPCMSGDGMTCQRPLRGETMRGERVALARSEAAPRGTTAEFEIITLNKNLERFIGPWLDYGAFMGMLQWRSGGMGRFNWELISE